MTMPLYGSTDQVAIVKLTMALPWQCREASVKQDLLIAIFHGVPSGYVKIAIEHGHS